MRKAHSGPISALEPQPHEAIERRPGPLADRLLREPLERLHWHADGRDGRVIGNICAL